MGQRANLLIVENRRVELFYCRWCANALDRELFWGPQHATHFIRRQRVVEDWLDEVWAEGACVVDHDRRVLLLFGGEDINYDVPLRRTYLELLRKVWSGWEVRWAHEGIAEVASYVGHPREDVLTPARPEPATPSLEPAAEKDWVDTVASIRLGSGELRFFPLADDVLSYLAVGPTIVEASRSVLGLVRLSLAEYTPTFPTGGFHVDVSRKQVDYWAARDLPDGGRRIIAAWPGWSVHWHSDRYESQLELTGGLLELPLTTRDAIEERLVRILLQDPGRSPVHAVADLVEYHAAKGEMVEVNPWALRDDRLPLHPATKRRILGSALGRRL